MRSKPPLKLIKIVNKNYGKISAVPVFITAELKRILEGKKKRDGTDLFSNLLARGFPGGKHLIETLQTKHGGKLRIVLSDQKSGASNGTVTIDFQQFGLATRGKFFAIYRETGLQAAAEFLRQEFPSDFPRGIMTTTAERKAVRKVFSNLPEAIKALPQREKTRVPGQLAELVSKTDPSFLYAVLKATEGISERTKLAIQELLAKISKEAKPAEAMQELTAFMNEWNLLQVTALLGILKSRLHTIATFEEMIHSEKTYELKGNNSIHRILEKSMWLIDDKYWIVQANRSLREFIGIELEKKDKNYENKRPDFACATYGNKLIIIEIKRPSIQLKKEALDQVEAYKLVIKKYKGARYSSIDAFLVGNRISEEARDLAELRVGIDLLTYQDLLENCRHRYNEYLNIIE